MGLSFDAVPAPTRRETFDFAYQRGSARVVESFTALAGVLPHHVWRTGAGDSVRALWQAQLAAIAAMLADDDGTPDGWAADRVPRPDGHTSDADPVDPADRADTGYADPGGAWRPWSDAEVAALTEHHAGSSRRRWLDIVDRSGPDVVIHAPVVSQVFEALLGLDADRPTTPQPL
ncbi:MAG: hypothetical protein ACRCZP_17655 [Phycicoccus sp.]